MMGWVQENSDCQSISLSIMHCYFLVFLIVPSSLYSTLKQSDDNRGITAKPMLWNFFIFLFLLSLPSLRCLGVKYPLVLSQYPVVYINRSPRPAAIGDDTIHPYRL